jgi:hypothetical protein
LSPSTSLIEAARDLFIFRASRSPTEWMMAPPSSALCWAAES